MLDLTHIRLHLRSGPSPGRRFLALALCALLVLGSLSPGIAAARESDSEGEGSGGPTVELPVPPDFDPGGEETGLEESPAPGEEEVGAVEPEAEVGIELPPAQDGAPAAVQPPAEPAAPQPAPAPVPEPAAPAYEPAQQPTETVAESEPVVNETIAAPPSAEVSAGDRDHPESAVQPEAPAPVEPEQQQEAPSSPQPVAVPPADPARSLTGKDSYVVRPGDCLWHIAAALLPSGADTAAIGDEVARLWHLNADRIGTGDPNLIYAGTTLRLR